MADKTEFRRSSWLISLPVMGICLLSGVMAVFFGQISVGSVLLFLFAAGAAARLWAMASVRRVSLRVEGKLRGLFPGESVTFDLEVRNEKLLPVFWMEVFCPLSEDLCLVPENSRRPDDWEELQLQEEGASLELVGEERLSLLLWYERVKLRSTWTARRRGVYSTSSWRLRTGDGFGLAQLERPIDPADVRQFAVYPRLIPVSPDLFLRNLWNADTGARGVMEDPTIIRSTREYMAADPVKHINWRLAARGLPLSVNVYEDILPRSVHFIFDGESFSGPPAHLEEMEQALSILASEVVRLSQNRVRCGLSLCSGAWGQAQNYFAAESPHVLLQAMAAYRPMEKKWDGEAHKYLPQTPEFDEGPIYDAAMRVGRFYYMTYDTAALSNRTLLQRLGQAGVTVLSYTPAQGWGGFETVCMEQLREGESAWNSGT